MSIDWSSLNLEQVEALSYLAKCAEMEEHYKRKRIEALIKAKNLMVSWAILGDAMGVPRETAISRYKAATRKGSRA
jgi:hypothetical protein